ncbi:hypothetical protein [Burkholderia stabilis]|uniref:hypothetical protein n=1 Tax=Burkholderia stabilis TaxID=95485 RepID=UPI001588CC49|nr:hypothetical protein [Burkholderia stabilis]
MIDTFIFCCPVLCGLVAFALGARILAHSPRIVEREICPGSVIGAHHHPAARRHVRAGRKRFIQAFNPLRHILLFGRSGTRRPSSVMPKASRAGNNCRFSVDASHDVRSK